MNENLKLLLLTFLVSLFAAMVAFLIVSFALIPLEDCTEQIENATLTGMAIATENFGFYLTQEAIRCNEVPITYQNISYTLYPLECLDLNNEGGTK